MSRRVAHRFLRPAYLFSQIHRNFKVQILFQDAATMSLFGEAFDEVTHGPKSTILAGPGLVMLLL